ncbi:condensin-2 complex subunit H2 isoform X2 [Parasteatoda tepidariorum]|uniref:condensin-2 complex subunit H2 isoform X2 n=2 Tax=Parasteatoda tepidariorum TaxID=114398 RepID=UPI001C7190C3|nr:condensin-2 complex subunit H2 isoform X2 [Parasteatoda tepidariorum]
MPSTRKRKESANSETQRRKRKCAKETDSRFLQRMAPPIEEYYHDLLQPVKDAEKSFQIDVAQLLSSYINNFVQGNVPANFNAAALVIQGSSSIYGRKVEFLYNLATQLYQNLVKNKKDEQAKKDSKTKDRHKESRFNDPFFSTEIKLGKNLSCLKKKNMSKASSNKKSKKEAKKCLFVPVDLLPFEGEEKGDTFYDTKGEAVGNKADHTLNKCKVTSSGWLILPTVCRDQIPTENSPPDYTFHCNVLNNIEVDDDGCDADMPCSTPDEGVHMGSQSISEVPSAEGTPEITLSQQTDEGLGSMQSTPQEMGSQSDSQPMEDNAGEIPIDEIVNDLDVPSTSLRRSTRHALKPQDEATKENQSPLTEEGNTPEGKEEEIVVVKKAIQKKNTCALPSKLKSNCDKKIETIAQFCARTFFTADPKIIKNGLMSLETEAFRNNSSFLRRLQARAEAIRIATRKSKKADEETEDVDVETLNAPDPDDMMMHDQLDDDDIVIQNDINDIPFPDEALASPEGNPETKSQSSHDVPMCSEDPIDENDLLIKDIKSLDKNSEITARVKAFEKRLNPFLDEVEKREAFDINLYGSRILNSFESSETKARKQTKTFRDFCKGMEQWQIHRYFMALLPLANIGNVSLETEEGPDGEEQICITLLSKRMHHLRLEEFGNEPTDSARK